MNKRQLLLPLLIIAALGLGGCGLRKATPSAKGPDSLQAVLAAQSSVKKFADAKELKQFFAARPVSSGSSGMAALDSRAIMTKESAVPSAAPASGLGGGAGQNFSTTNIQVQGVDESDIVKTDGTYIYSVSEQNILITRAVPVADLKLVATIALDSRPQEIYLSGDRLITFGYANQVQPTERKMAPGIFVPQSSFTFVAAYDISDRTAPKLIRRIELEGNYLSSRLIARHLYLITANYNFYPAADANPLPRIMENGQVISSDQTTDKYTYPEVYYIDAPTVLNATTVTAFNLDDLLAAPLEQVYLMPAGETVYASTDNLYIAYTKYLSEYDMKMALAREILAPRLSAALRQRLEQIAAIDPVILSDDEKLYKTNQVIQSYIASLAPDEQSSLNKDLEAEFSARHPNIAKELEKTVVHKIALQDGRMAYQGAGEVTGRLLNQYSLDEFGGHLRLATTRQRNWFTPFMLFASDVAMPAPATSDSFNNVYILDGNLKVVGQLEDMAKGESIYAVRFMGERAYVVTFRQVDPLFVLDLAVAEKPAVLGQLKVPGFSNYLHPYSDTLLIGIGKEATDKGEQGVEVGGLKASLFDVSAPESPKEISSVALGGRGSDSIAAYDYKAVLFSKEKGIIAFPASLTAPANTDYRPEFQGIVVLTVTPEKISERGRIAFRLPEQMNKDNSYFDDNARRALYIDDALYTYSAASLKANRLSDLKALSSLDLPRPAQIALPVKPMLYETSPALPR